ncbi:TPA: hypothetical protein ACH3X1_001649 [Trebouxia sp. C0004]
MAPGVKGDTSSTAGATEVMVSRVSAASAEGVPVLALISARELIWVKKGLGAAACTTWGSEGALAWVSEASIGVVIARLGPSTSIADPSLETEGEA